LRRRRDRRGVLQDVIFGDTMIQQKRWCDLVASTRASTAIV
jgi:hypothetical protein